nr:DNA polymerase Y family protein [Schlegelella koreensis]
MHLPSLSLESFEATLAGRPAAAGTEVHAGDGGAGTAAGAGSDSATPAPIALIDAHRIVAGNAVAQALGVRPGLKRATALALAPQLVLGQADAARDAAALLPVAHAALAFTPQVVIARAGHPFDDAHTVLLEVEASLRYFGGLERLLQRLGRALAPLGHVVHCATAPTAQGAALLARQHPDCHCADDAALQRALDELPVWRLGAGREHRDALQAMGLRTLGDLRALPRAGLARRFGEALLAELDAALGTRPDPRVPLALPATFESRLELFARADTTEQLLHGAAVLLARLVAWLSAQHAFVRRFTLVMQHETRWRRSSATPAESVLEIALAEPSRDREHLLVLLRERLARIELPAPTLDLRLAAADIARRAAPNSELFPTARSEVEGLTRLIERLQARLGAAQVQRLAPLDEHRPERASALQAVDAARVERLVKAPRAAGSSIAGAAGAARRPVWLLPEPQPLPERQSRPFLDGSPLQLLSGPERIETGWWDCSLAERDYFIAQNGDGALVWIYRARLPLETDGEPRQGWFMQGRFG